MTDPALVRASLIRGHDSAYDASGPKRSHPSREDTLGALVTDLRAAFDALADVIDADRRVLDTAPGLDYRTRAVFDKHARIARRLAAGELLPPDLPDTGEPS